MQVSVLSFRLAPTEVDWIRYSRPMSSIDKFSFWNSNLGYRERRALNEAAQSLEDQELQNAHQARSLIKLFALDRAQADEITELRAMVAVLAEMLVQENVVSGDILEMRLKDRLRAIEEAKRPKSSSQVQTSHPYRSSGIPEAPTVPEPVTSCTRCGEQVLARDTQITEFGVVCDTCYYV